jgi:hypothetical protein
MPAAVIAERVGWTGSISWFRERVRAIRPTAAVLRHQFEAGPPPVSLRGVRTGRPDPRPRAYRCQREQTSDTDRNRPHRQPRRHRRCPRGQELALGAGIAGPRLTLRLDAGLIHATAGDMLLKTLPKPLFVNESRQIRDARPATSAPPSPPPAGPQSVQRRVPTDGVVMVAGQRLRVGRTHAGAIVTIVVEHHHFRVLDGIRELSLHARTSTKPSATPTPTAPVNGNHVPITMRHLCPETTQVNRMYLYGTRHGFCCPAVLRKRKPGGEPRRPGSGQRGASG